MGRKSRKGSKHYEDDAEPDSGTGTPPSSDPNINNTPNQKDTMDFAQRRDLQRQQAANKRRNKMKCHLCGECGHARRDCPGIADDGRGMSRYKGKSDPKKEKQNYRARKYGEGEAAAVGKKPPIAMVDFPREFYCAEEGVDECCPLLFHDAGCNVVATMDYLRSGRGKHRISQKEAFDEYQDALGYASKELGLSGLISETYLYKPTLPWIEPSLPEDFPVRAFYVVSLALSYKCNTDERKHQATHKLLEARESNPSKIIGFWGQLDYTPKTVSKGGCYTRDEQFGRLKCTLDAAGKSRVPLRIKTSPGAAGLDPEQQSVAGTPYASVLLDLQSILLDSLSKYPGLTIHLSCWSGRADHMMSILNEFSNTAIGLDGSVSFSKAKHLHECCFEVPIDRFLLETSTVIPACVANCLGREAAFHSGWWPHVADAVACQRKIPVVDVARAATETALRIYPELLAGPHANNENGVAAP